MNAPVPLLIAIAVLMILSALFSATETAFNSVNLIKIKSIISNGSPRDKKRAKRVLKVSSDYDKLLSTILIGNNLVNILMSSLATVFCGLYFSENAAVTVSTAATTVLVLVFGEISPKFLAKNAPESFAMSFAPPAAFLMILLTPLNWLFRQWMKLLGKIFKQKADTSYNEDDLISIVEEAEQGGQIDSDESEIIRSAIEFNEQNVFTVLTPRVDIVSCDEGDSNEDIFEVFRSHGFSRLPVTRGDLDSIVGIINEKDFCEKVLYGNETLDSIMVRPKFVTLYTKISELMSILQKEKCHMAIAVDEYGGTAGIITLEDILEELVGEIWDEHDTVEDEYSTQDDGSCKVNANISVNDFFDHFGIDDTTEAATAAGWAIEHLAKIPEQGDSFSYSGYTITVCDVEDKRILHLLLSGSGIKESEEDL